MSEMQKVTFEKVSAAALEMLSTGVKPSVRRVLDVTGGKTEVVASFLRDFNDKRDHEISKMADELGSSAIAGLLATEIQNVVDRKTLSLTEIIDRQKVDIAELVELLDVSEKSALHRVEMADATRDKTTREAHEKIKSAERAKEEMRSELLKIKNDSEAQVASAERRADALVEAANEQKQKFELEVISLREQVNQLAIDHAKREMELSESKERKERLANAQIELANKNTNVVQLETEKKAFERDIGRLEKELQDVKGRELDFNKSQFQLVELQKQLSQSQNDLSQAQREINTLTQMLPLKK